MWRQVSNSNEFSLYCHKALSNAASALGHWNMFLCQHGCQAQFLLNSDTGKFRQMITSCFRNWHHTTHIPKYMNKIIACYSTTFNLKNTLAQ